MKHLKTYNESIMGFLKPKSKDKISNAIKKMKPEEKFIKACEHGLMWLVEEMLSDPNFDPSIKNNEGVLQAGIHKHEDIVNLLLKNEKVIRGFYESRLKPRLPDENDTEEDDNGEMEDPDYDDDFLAGIAADERRPLTDHERFQRLLRTAREELDAELSADELAGLSDEELSALGDEDDDMDDEDDDMDDEDAEARPNRR